MAALGWSSLPADLVNRVADCLLATNDLDWYADLRAVCHHWRSVTADPASRQHDPRYRPTRWVLLDEHRSSSAITVGGGLLFVNTSTGRFLRRNLLLLHDHDCYAFVTSTTDGLVVLAAREPPHAVSVLNPLTGSLIRFVAPLPRCPGPRLTADVVGSSPTLVLVSVATRDVYWADPKSESFSEESHGHGHCPASRMSQIAAAVDHGHESVPAGAKNIFDQLQSEEAEGCRCYAVVVAGGDMLAVLKRRRGMDIFRIDAAGNMMERVESIGRQALFLGVRCLVVDTDRFPTVEANCAYFQLAQRRCDTYIYKFTIGTCGDQQPEFVAGATGHFRPFTVTQVLSNYTMDIPRHPLPLERCCYYLEANDYVAKVDCYEEYIDYAHEGSYEEYIDYVDRLGDYIADSYGSESEDDWWEAVRLSDNADFGWWEEISQHFSWFNNIV